MSKRLTIVLIILLSIISFSLVACLFYAIKSDFKFENFNSSNLYSKKLVDEKEINSIKDLDIQTNRADVKVEEHDSDKIKVEIYSNYAKKYSIVDEEKIKVLLEENKKSFFTFGFKSSIVKIYVPNNYNMNIKINSKVGDIKIKNIGNASLNVKSDIGDVKVSEIDTATIESRVGDVKIQKVNKLTSKIQTGDTKIGEVNNITSKTKTGDIKINSVNEYLKLQSKTGDVKINSLRINKSSSIDSNVGDVKIKQTKNCYIEGKSNVGEVNINNNDRKSNFILTITSKVGDVKVNY